MKDDRFTICREANYRSLLSSTSSVLVEQIWPNVCCWDTTKPGQSDAIVFELAMAPQLFCVAN